MTEPRVDDPEIARKIQSSLLPASLIRIGSWEAAGLLIPGEECGDLFDYYPLDNGRYAVSVTRIFGGEGIEGRFVMSDLRAAQRSLLNGTLEIPEALERLNDYVRGRIDRYIDMKYLELDAGRGILHFANVSYYAPILLRQDGSLVWLVTRNQPMLGVATDMPFSEGQLSIEPGDSLLLYTEGVIRALDPLGLLFGEGRLPKVWKERAGGSPSDVVAALCTYVQEFRDRALFGSLEGLLSLSELKNQCPLEPIATEARGLRKRPALRCDVTMVVLGQLPL